MQMPRRFQEDVATIHTYTLTTHQRATHMTATPDRIYETHRDGDELVIIWCYRFYTKTNTTI